MIQNQSLSYPGFDVSRFANCQLPTFDLLLAPCPLPYRYAPATVNCLALILKT